MPAVIRPHRPFPRFGDRADLKVGLYLPILSLKIGLYLPILSLKAGVCLPALSR
jgi:hypothetical protein